MCIKLFAIFLAHSHAFYLKNFISYPSFSPKLVPKDIPFEAKSLQIIRFLGKIDIVLDPNDMKIDTMAIRELVPINNRVTSVDIHNFLSSLFKTFLHFQYDRFACMRQLFQEELVVILKNIYQSVKSMGNEN